MDARRSGGEGAFSPGFDRASLARPQGRLRAPNVRSVVLCLSNTCPSACCLGTQWSSSAAVSCHCRNEQPLFNVYRPIAARESSSLLHELTNITTSQLAEA